MGRIRSSIVLKRIIAKAVLVTTMPMFISCSGMDPRDVDVDLEKSAPEAKITNYTQALSELGRMSEIFATGVVRIQCSDIADNTGTSMTTGGEIQKNITEIMKSTLNSMGGNIVFIEYDPSFIQNQMVTGYSNFEAKVIPDVVITGGITEFDRGLESRDTGVDAAGSATVSGMPGWVPSDEIGINYGNTGKTGKARITLDFNMKDFTTLAGVPKMTTTNSMEVHKAVKQKEVGITLFGPTFGLKGAIKKVQGRHEAVRLLVQVSMIQMVGKYLAIPYWRLLGEDTLPDPIVIESIIANYYALDATTRIALAQQWMKIHGYDVDLTGRIDAKTQAAMQKFNPAWTGGSEISEKDFVDLYISMPFDAAALGRRNALNNLISQAMAGQQPEPDPAPMQVQAPAQAPAAMQEAYEEPAPQPAPRQASAPAAPQAAPTAAVGGNTTKNTGFGRKLSDSEW